jgi:CxxC motif-containing protein (DUF1111 family)
MNIIVRIVDWKDPEVSNGTALDVVFYLKTLKAPYKESKRWRGQAGKQIFVNIGCAKCHTPQLQTGPSRSTHLANKISFHIVICCFMIWEL